MALSVRDLKALLGKHQNYLTQNGEINAPLLYRYAQECNTDLLTLLSTNDDARNEFFIRHGEHIIFVRDRFIDYIHHKDFLANSYTAYKNRVGLAGSARYGDLSLLKSMHDVVLSFPFKDCVLEGGQNKDEAKRNECYYNRVLAANEIDRLLDPKVLTNAQRYTEQKRQPLTEFTRDANINEQRGSSADTITDNLIIKGNNLLALHTLREQFAHKVKLIYIDPPYNTGNDSFHYNDNFNHSTWLVFMKNRLEAARELLRQDGVIFVQCDDNEQAYLKVLMDEVFKQENFVANFMWMKTSTPPSLSKNVRKKLEYILCYQNGLLEGLRGGIAEGGDMPLLNTGNKQRILVFPPKTVKFTITDNIYLKAKKERVQLIEDVIVKERYNENSLIIKGDFKWNQEKLNEEISSKTEFIIKSDKFAIRYARPGERVKKPSNLISKTECNVGTNEDAKKEIESLFTHKIFDYPKPETLISYLINMATEKNDIVLDYHLGSGTTAAVAHKMGRQYIGIEQMDYIESVSVARLQKVIEGEPGGISKAAKWEGGGNFVYFELKAHNQTFISHIASATTTKELLAIKADILAKADLDYRLDTKMVAQSPEEFSALSLEYQKQILLDFLEINQLYVPYTERNDTRFACTDKEKHISEMFYQQL